MTTTNTVVTNEIPLDNSDPTKTAWGSSLASQYYFVIANGTSAAETFDANDLSTGIRTLMASYGRGVSVAMGGGGDTVIGSAYGDTITTGNGVNYVDGGANNGQQPGGGAARDILNVFAKDQAAADALGVTAIAANATGADGDAYAAGYRIKVSNGSETDYLKNVEQINVFLAGGAYIKTVRLAVEVYDNIGTQDPAAMMHLAWAQGTGFDDSFSAATGISSATRDLMTQNGRGVWVDLGAGNDTITGSGFGDDITAGSGTNYVDGGANAGSPPWGGKAQDVLHVVVADQAAASAVQVTKLADGMSGLDADAFSKGYTHKVSANGETDYVKGIERVSVEVGNGNGSSWVRDIPLAVVAHEANLSDPNINQFYHLAWVNGTANGDVIDASGDTPLLSAELKAAMAQKGRGVWIDGGAGDDTITGSGYADNIRNGAGSSKIDGGANTGGNDVFEISVASTAEMNAVTVTASDDPAYTWMVSYGAGSTQKDYLKNVEAITVNVAGTNTGKWIPLVVQVQEIAPTAKLDDAMHYAWAQGTSGADTVNAATNISAATRDLMTQHGRGFWAETGAGNDTITGSGFGDDITAGSGTNYVDGGANAGSPPWGGKAQDVLHVVVADQAAASAVQVTKLADGMSGLDADAFSKGYTHKVSANGETDYVKGIERVSVEVGNGNGSSWVRDIPLAVVVQEAKLTDPNVNQFYHLAWVNGTANGDVIDASGDTALLSAELKAAMAQKGRGVWIDGGAGDDTITGTGYADNIRNGAGNSKIDGGANAGGNDVFEITVASTAEMNAVTVTASDDPAYTWMVTYGAGSTQKDYLKNIEAITVNVAGTNTGKWIPLVVQVQEIAPTAKLDDAMHYAWAHGTSGADTVNAATDISAATRDLMTQHGRGFWAETGAGNDTITGSGFGDDITAGSGTNYVDGGANAGSPPWGGKAQDVLHVVVADQAAASAVQVTKLADGMSGLDADAFSKGYTHKVSANGETDYVKGIERVSVEVSNGNGSSWVRDIPLAVVAHEANLSDPNINQFYHLAWVNGTANGDVIDASGDTPLLSAELKAAMAQKGRGVWIDGGAGDDTITGSGYADNIRNGAGSSKIDGGANTGGNDVFEISVASTAEMNAVTVTASDDPAYTWMVSYGAGSTQKDYLKNVEAITVNVAGTNTGKWIPLVVQVQEIAPTAKLDDAMHYAWAQGTSGADTVNAATNISAATRDLMTQHGRGFWAETGAGNDTITGSGFGDDITAGSGTNYVDGGANAGSPPWGGKAQDVLHVVVADQAAASAVQVTKLADGMSGLDADAFSKGYTHKVSANGETDYVKGIERVSVEVSNGNGSSWVRDIPLAVVVQEAKLTDPNVNQFYHLAWVNGTANGDVIDASGDTALLSAELKAAMAQKGRGVWIDGGAGDDTVTGSGYADNIRNGAGNSKIDGGANTGGNDVFEISVASTAEMNAVRVAASDDPAYTWMVSYGAGSTQKDYLKNIEAITVNVAGTTTGKWIPLTLRVQEIASTDNLDNAPYYAWVQGTTEADSFDANTVISSATRDLMAQHGRGVYVDLGNGDDTITGSAFGDDITAGAGTNYVDGGANTGSMPGGAAGADRLEVYVANQAQANAVAITALGADSTGKDAAAFAAGYRYKVVNGTTEIDYVKNIEQVAVTIWDDKNGDGIRDGGELATVRTIGFAPNTAPSFAGAPAGVAVYDAGSDFGLLGGTVLADGKLLGLSYVGDADTGHYSVVLVRANADGSSDSSFGQDGAVVLPTSYGTGPEPVVLADGKIVIGLRTPNAGELKFMRFNPDGSVDTSFGTGGATSVTVGAGTTVARKLLVDGAGKLVLVGQTATGTNADMVVVRLNANGNLDTGFNGTGKLVLAPSSGSDAALDAVLQADGKLLLAGYVAGADGSQDWAVLRLNQDGSYDTTFGTGGKVVMPVGASHDAAWAIQTLAGGKIVIAGSTRTGNATSDTDQVVMRLNANGSLDTSFGSGGKVVTHLSDRNDLVSDMQVQADGKVVVLGTVNNALTGGLGGEFSVTRYNADGSLDTSFGKNGTARLSVHGVGESSASLALVGGKIVVFGSSYNDTSFNTSSVVYRLNGDGSLDTSFAPNRDSSLGDTTRTTNVEPVVLDNNASIYDAELAGSNFGGATLTLGRHGGASAEDVFGATGGVSFAGGKITVDGAIIGTAVQKDGLLTLAFSNAASQGLVNRVMHGITYLNGSATAPERVTIDWTFSDGNNGDQGPGGAKTATGATIVEIGLMKYETVRDASNPAKAVTGQLLSQIGFLAELAGSSRADSFDAATGFSSGVKALMDEFKHGARFEMGPGNDTVTGTGYSDEFVMGTGVNRVDGGANAGAMPYEPNSKGRDVLTVYVANDAAAKAVTVTLLSGTPADAADAAALATGYDVKVVNGAETDYLKNIESVRIYKWNDANGNGQQDGGEVTWVREIPLAVRVVETTVNATDPSKDSSGQPLANIWHLARVDGWDRDDSFNAATDVSAAAQALMAQQGRGVWVDLGAGNDTMVGSAYGDNFIGGDGVNYIDGGANGGVTPNSGQRAYDTLEVYARSGAGAVRAIALSAGMAGADGAAFAAGYTFKVVNGSEIDYVKNVEGVNVFAWNDANGDGQRDYGSETTYSHRIVLSTMVDEVAVNPGKPGQDAGGNPLSNLMHFAWANGGSGDDRFDASTDVSAGTRALMAQYGRGVYADLGGGNDTVTGSAYGDNFILGAGVNRLDGGANGGTDTQGNPARDVLDVYVANQAAADAVTITALSADMTGADGAAYADGYRYKVANGTVEVDYVKNVEQVNIQIWNDKDGDGERDYAGTDPANEVTYVRGLNLMNNTAPTFGAPAGMAISDAGYDLTPVGAVTIAGGKTVVLAAIDQVDEGGNYILALLRRNADGTADTGFGNGSGRVLLPTYFGNIAKPAVQADGKIVVAVSTAMSGDADFRITRFNADGSLDSGFGTNGETVVSLGAFDNPATVLVQPDGKLVIVGSTTGADRDFSVVRLNTNGSLDTSFNGTGKLVATLPAARDGAVAAAFDAQGGIIIVGSSQTGTASDASLIRVKPDGTLDTAFAGGTNLLPIGPNNDYASSVTVLASGKILVGGNFYVSPDNTIDTSAALMKLNADGTLDTSFGIGGKVAVAASGAGDRIRQVLEQSDGKIVISGWVNGHSNNGGQMVVARFNPDGSIDTSFGNGGATRIPLLDLDARDLMLNIVDGKIVLVGASSFNPSFDAHLVLARLNADGSFDTSFNPGSGGSLGSTVKADGIHPVVLDFNASVYDADLAARGNYAGASLKLVRQGGASAEDHFTGVGEVSFAGGNLSVAGIGIGWVQQSGGTLTLNFNVGATQELVTRALHGIAYTSGAASPAASVTIDWLFSDNNEGSQGFGGALAATGSSTVQIGVTTHDVVRAYVDPARSADNRELSKIDFMSVVDGTARGESVSPANVGAAARGLMDQYQRGIKFDMGAGDDTVTGSNYSDWFEMGSGVNYVDGGANTGSHPYGGEGRDTLIVYARNQAEADAVSVVRLEAGMSGADADAFAAGYEAKVVNGSEIDYIKNIENADVHLWTDNNGNGVVDPGEGRFQRGLEFRMNVSVTQLTDPEALKTQFNLAWVNGTKLNDSFNAATDLPAGAKALMDQYQRGVYADLREGNDTFTGSDYGDSISAGAGVNRIDGGANQGTDPGGFAAKDRLDIVVASADAAKAVKVVALSAGMGGADQAAFDAGYTYKVDAGAEVDYVRNVERVDLQVWNDANGNGQRDAGEMSYGGAILLAVDVSELRVKADDPTKEEYGTPLAQIDTFAYVNGTAFADTVTASQLLSAPTLARMAAYGRGVSFDLHGGGDTVTGSQYSDMFVLGKGVNFVDGGAQDGSHPWGQSADIIDIYVASQAELDAVQLVALTGALTGTDAAAKAAGFQYKIVAGAEIDYLKGIEQYNVSIWNDKNGDGMRWFSNDDKNEVSGTKYISIPDPAPEGTVSLVGVDTTH